MEGEALDAILPAIYLILGAVLLRGIILWLSEITAQTAASRIKKTLRDRLFRHIQNLGTAWTGRQSSGELASTATSGIEKLDTYYARFIPAAIHMGIVPPAIVLFVIGIDWISGLILLVTGPLIPVFMSFIGMKALDQSQKQWATLSRLSAFFLDSVQGLRTLKLFNHTTARQHQVEKMSDDFRKTTMGVLKIAFLSGFVLELFASIATALVAVEIGVRLIEGHIGFQLGLFVLLLAPEYYLPFRMFGAQHHAGMEGTEAAERIFEILETPAQTTFKESEKKAFPEPPYEITYHNVTFSYPGSTASILRGCSFRLKSRSTTALVGRSGTGKTTLVRLLTGQYQPNSGSISVNGIPDLTLDQEEWLSKIAIVSQGIWLFDDTVLANLKIARPRASFEEVVEATKAAQAHEFIERLPEGYHTQLGEHAGRLSGGERQRLGIARALLRDAPLVILDEPSSALDPESEHQISRALETLLVNRTVLIIAHRLSTVRNADRILVLDKGNIVAEGTHQELLHTETRYQKMVNINHTEST